MMNALTVAEMSIIETNHSALSTELYHFAKAFSSIGDLLIINILLENISSLRDKA